MRSRIAWTVATWFGCGLVPLAPGTAGSLAAIPVFLLLRRGGPVLVIVAAAVLSLVGVWAAGHVVRATKQRDPQVVVVDEVAGMLITLLPSTHGWPSIALGFVLFRMFDQFKPWPARRLESLPGGWGVVMDDVAAGVWGALALHGLHLLGMP